MEYLFPLQKNGLDFRRSLIDDAQALSGGGKIIHMTSSPSAISILVAHIAYTSSNLLRPYLAELSFAIEASSFLDEVELL